MTRVIKHFKLEQGHVVEAGDDCDQILHVVTPDDAEKAMLIEKYQIDPHNLASAQDPDEMPRIEVEDNHMVVIFKHPKSYSAKDNLLFRIDSVGIFLYAEKIIVVSPPRHDPFRWTGVH